MNIEDFLPSSEEDPISENDFLIREGFDLLAAFRAIENEHVRESILDMIVSVAAADQRAKHDRL